jgi:2-oxoglutarate/2-oxoacid ferredoxin oxidoreductase subunit alpha
MGAMSETLVSLGKRSGRELPSAVVRFSGDSGDGMQLTGTQFTHTAATLGNDLATFPDFPAEIRAPAGSTFGVSGYQVNFASQSVFTAGDQPDVLVAMNPAALKTNIDDLREGGILIVNRDAFTQSNLERVGYADNPLENGSLDRFRTFSIDINTQVESALKELNLGFKAVGRTKNFWTLGLIYYLYNRPLDSTLRFIEDKFGNKPELQDANRLALKAGYLYGEVSEIFQETFEVRSAPLAPGLYRNITGNQATAWGAVAAAAQAGLGLFYGSYPITPASDILHELSRHKSFGVTTFQAEDEIAAIGAAIGASFVGQLGMTGSSGPGIALKGEAMGLAVSVELPLLILNIQRGGPSTGMPTKTEQADLYQAMFGRNGECPMPILAASTPSDCFETVMECARLALKYMTPVIFLSDGYLANGSEPWRIPDETTFPKIDVSFRTDPNGFHPFLRNEATLARAWALPGTVGLEHRIGGLEKDYDSGNISYDPLNHERMVETRKRKIDNIENDIPDAPIFGSPEGGDLLVIGWGSSYGPIRQAVHNAREIGLDVSHMHLRHLHPFSKNVGSALERYRACLVPEMNLGQLATLLRARFLKPVHSYTKVQGKPFMVEEVLSRIRSTLQTL